MTCATWRLLIDEPLDGAANMARDEAILIAQAAGAAPPTLRLYRWRPACLSLGRFQRSDQIDRAACERSGVEVVRRPSGGRAILHDDELTYAVVARADDRHLDGGSILGDYRRISAALLVGLRRIGVEAELTPVQRADRRPTTDDRRPGRQGDKETRRQGDTGVDLQPSAFSLQPSAFSVRPSSFVLRPSSAACFDALAAYELTAGSRKLIGSAQMRRGGALLQHGSIPLAPHADRLAALLIAPPADLGAKMIALGELLDRQVAFEEVVQAILGGFEEAWGIAFAPGELTAEERALAQQLRVEKYSNGAWTYVR